MIDTDWRGGFVLAAHAATASERNGLARSARRGATRRVARGVYTDVAAARFDGERHRETVRAIELRMPGPVFSHRSAAAIRAIPRLGAWPTRAEVIVPQTRRRRSTPNLVRRITDVPFESETVDGVRVTGLNRTLVDLARTDDLASAVVSPDHGLASAGDETSERMREELSAELALAGSRRGTANARFAIGFADGRAESPGESLSRLQIHRLGVLRHGFTDERGTMRVDFWWPELGIAGEFDGAGKYLLDPDPAAVRGALLAERRREDRLRGQVERVVRWDWATASDRSRLGLLLRRSGIR